MFGQVALVSVHFAAVVAGLPAYTNHVHVNAHHERGAITDRYTFYAGDGSTGAGWPSQDAWGSWDALWNANALLMKQTCGWNGWGANNSDDEIDAIESAIQELADQTGVDNRFILAVMMQESKGCVRAPTTSNGVTNPGLMQSHNGKGTCANTNPCPASQITQMISDGVAGTSSGDGLQQVLDQARGVAGEKSTRSFYAAARLYNSGLVDYNSLDKAMGSTPCYVSDIANRLTGWTLAGSSCRI
ncbi:hypothetical protein J3459_016265 [Metarhizium acridum]|uniref:Muramidase n=1 Tax=Metarhizium acridum (strain CQMa 102) TaxID=655827 RepID=E9EHD2_METAQ|nr:uncharacterized protein MAC_09280 [Metarhizium acridum CQMa 102]EFY84690.1 hypothetical protein MAC_09280 [Metarhizium acridum CQMa 102]KAG8406095.1 hypothetical protein J3458_021426 [Metarhizium acridum]KAG8411757.1 hypothetical protein J3459_016265 [Metarhizium acridum]